RRGRGSNDRNTDADASDPLLEQDDIVEDIDILIAVQEAEPHTDVVGDGERVVDRVQVDCVGSNGHVGGPGQVEVNADQVVSVSVPGAGDDIVVNVEG